MAGASTLLSFILLIYCERAEARPHEFTTTFAGSCASEPCLGGTLKKPAGVAVEESDGDIYVADEGANRVVVYDKEGHYLSEVNGSGLLAGEEHAAGSLGNPGEVETGKFLEPQTIAVDNSCVLEKLPEPQCKAKDPSAGDVYVVDSGEEHRVVDKYSPSGPSKEHLEYVGQIAAGEAGRFTRAIDGVAVGAKGTVWVYQNLCEVSAYSDASPNLFTPPQKQLNCLGFGRPGFAVDGAGDFYLHQLLIGPRNVIAKESPLAEVLIEDVGGKEASGVAAEQGSNDSLIDNLTSVGVFDATGEEVERLGEEGGVKHLGESNGVGVNESASTVYATDAPSGQVVVFGPKPATVPKVESESIEEVSSIEATLGARINPRSEVGEAPSKYHFEYGRCANASDCAASGYEEVPGSGGQIPADFEVHAVSAKLSGLAPHTTYHFRALAENSHGQGPAGEEVIFTSEGAGGQPALPDERAWELVSPPDKLGALIEPISEAGVAEASASGDAITYLANSPTEAQPAGYSNDVQILSERGAAAWSSRDIAISHPSTTGLVAGAGGTEYKFFNSELSAAVVQPFGQFNPLLSSQASESTAYLHSLSESCGASCFTPLVSGKPGSANVPAGTQFGETAECQPKVAGNGSAKVFCGPQFLGASEDLGHIVLHAKAELVAGAGEAQLYEWNGGALAPVSVLPDGEAALPGASLGESAADGGGARGAISPDGSLIDWTGPIGGLYLRDTARGETIELDEAQGGSGASGGGEFQLAAADGRRVLFTDTQKLTADSGAEPGQGAPGEGHADLYECAIVLSPAPSCQLRDLTPVNGGEGAQVQGSILGASADGAYVYYVAKGVQSVAPNARGQKAQPEKANLYLSHEGQVSFIATLSGGDEKDWRLLNGTPEALFTQPTRVSEDGRYLEFMSQGSPTGYDNRDRASAKPVAEVYLYDAYATKLVCASCLASGERPVGIEYKAIEPPIGLAGGPVDIWPEALVAASVPGWTATERDPRKTLYQPRYLNDSGRLFFNSFDGLIAEDSNKTEDVYEYEPPAVGNCSETAQSYDPSASGCVALISSGSSSQESAFLDASESGNDVFFLTSSQLSKADQDSARDVYDAHVCTSASPCITAQPSEPSSCSGEGCKPPLSPPSQIFAAPPSQSFSGPGNLAAALAPAPKPKSAEELRVEKLNKALKACRSKQNKKKRQACESAARKRYAKPKPKAKAKKKGKKKK